MAWLWENSGFHRAWLCPPAPHTPIRSYFPLKPFWILIAHLQQTMASKDLCFCHCRGCSGCGHEAGWGEYQPGFPCWNQPARGQRKQVAQGWNPDFCRCAFCLEVAAKAAAAPAAAAAAANEADAPAEVDAGADARTAAAASAAVAAASAANAKAAADTAWQAEGSAAAAAAGATDGDQWAADLMRRLAALEQEVQGLRVALPRGSACSPSEEAWPGRHTFYLLGDAKAHAGDRTPVVASGTPVPVGGWEQGPRGPPGN